MSFNFQVVVTESCNLGCTYCYMGNKNTVMTPDTFDKHYEMLPQMMEEYGETDYVLAFFGGEPLVNFKLMKYILEKTKDDPRCVGRVMMSNGTMLTDDQKMDLINEYSVSISLSFDGLWNRYQRPFANGESTFEHYVKYKDLYNQGSCKVMVAPESLDTLVENFQWFVEDFGIPTPDFTIVRDDVWTDEDVALFSEKSRGLADKIIEYHEDGKSVMAGFYLLYMLDTIYGKIYGKRQFGCFAGNKGAGFMPDGEVYSCARFGSEKEIPLANSLDGEINRKNLDAMNSDLVKNPAYFKKCQTCMLKQFCNGGCTHSQLRQAEDGTYYSKPVDQVCDIYHILYRDAFYIARKLKDNKVFKETMQRAFTSFGDK